MCRPLQLTALLLGSLLASRPASAGQFNVAPTRVALSGTQHSTLVTVANTGTEPLRFQVTPYRWDQQVGDDLVLQPTTDVVVFPSLFTVAPGESRKLRVGITTPAGETEGAWRMFVEELPPLDADGRTGVRVLTRAGIPIFLAAAAERPRGAIADVHAADGRLALSVENSGNVHVMLQQVDVTGRREDGGEAFAAHARGWYVLPGRARAVELDLPSTGCEGVTTLDIRAITDQGTWTRQVPATPEMCRR